MKPEFLQTVLNDTLASIKDTLRRKSIEYAREHNPMHNFEKGAIITGLTREEVIRGFALKHHISIDDIRNDIKKGMLPKKETIEEKFNDAIIYLILEKSSMLDRISALKE